MTSSFLGGRPEGQILSANVANARRLWNGSLWVGLALSQGSITRRRTAVSTVFYMYKTGESLSVLPMGSEWCLVILQNKILGWARLQNISVKPV